MNFAVKFSFGGENVFARSLLSNREALRKVVLAPDDNRELLLVLSLIGVSSVLYILVVNVSDAYVSASEINELCRRLPTDDVSLCELRRRRDVYFMCRLKLKVGCDLSCAMVMSRATIGVVSTSGITSMMRHVYIVRRRGSLVLQYTRLTLDNKSH